MTLVLDASAVLTACLAARGFAHYGREELVAPPLLWSEVRSTLHEAVSRGELTRDRARQALSTLESGRLRPRTDRRLGEEAWVLADSLGWAKTYDAEYVALAKLLRCRLVTTDERMRRGTVRLGFVIGPAEL